MNPSEIEIDVKVDDAFVGRVDVERLTRAATATLQQQGITDAAILAIVITGDEAVRRLNHTYRGVDAPTDVLSFENANQGGFVAGPEASGYLGDVIISFPRAKAQAQSAGHLVEAELQLLTVHGVLHLLGHDHAEPDQKTTMWIAQAQTLRELDAPVADLTPEPDR